ncbi:MAG: proton-conducting transporter membrane subunit [cyanobacterium endosymbiont of Rhopalodia fuxianensis]
MLQSISHRLVAAALFFLESVIYDRTNTMILEEIKNISLVMLKVFTLFAIDTITYPALPEMGGFTSDLSVFVGITYNDI